MSRPLLITSIVLGALAFLAISGLVARVLSAQSAERAAAVDIVKVQARGEPAAVIDRLEGCAQRPACVAKTRAMTARLARPGKFDVLTVRSPGFSLGARTATTRVAWKTGTRLPVVQCITARRAGSLFGGFRIELLTLSAPIGRESSCP
jgi:hypothetical protein